MLSFKDTHTHIHIDRYPGRERGGGGERMKMRRKVEGKGEE